MSPRRSRRSGSSRRAVHRQVPVGSLRRTEAACGDRASDHPQPGAARRRRARLDARHERAREDPRAHARSSSASSGSPISTSRTISRRRSSSAIASRFCISVGSSRSGRRRRSTRIRSIRIRRRFCKAIPEPDPRRSVPRDLPRGEVPDAARPPLGCSFHPRCPAAFEVCGWESRDLRDLLEARWAQMSTDEYESEQAVLGDLSKLDARGDGVPARRSGAHRGGDLIELLDRIRADDPAEPFWRGVGASPRATDTSRSSCTTRSSHGSCRWTACKSSATSTTRRHSGSQPGPPSLRPRRRAALGQLFVASFAA